MRTSAKRVSFACPQACGRLGGHFSSSLSTCISTLRPETHAQPASCSLRGCRTQITVVCNVFVTLVGQAADLVLRRLCPQVRKHLELAQLVHVILGQPGPLCSGGTVSVMQVDD